MLKTNYKYKCKSFLETHITHGCNLNCYGCTHYTDYGIKKDWFVSPKQFEDDIKVWANRIDPCAFLLLGGEPTLHPNLCELLIIAAHYFRGGTKNDLTGTCPVGMTTNGSFLHTHPNLKKTLLSNNIGLILSAHYNPTDKIIQTLKEWKKDGVQINIWEFTKDPKLHWRKLYKGHGETMKPFDDDPIISWQKCQCRKFFQIHEGKLWKCAPIAYFSFVNEKFNLTQNEKRWNKFAEYTPLDPTCTRTEMREFLERQHEDMCGLCPANDLYSVNESSISFLGKNQAHGQASLPED